MKNFEFDRANDVKSSVYVISYLEFNDEKRNKKWLLRITNWGIKPTICAVETCVLTAYTDVGKSVVFSFIIVQFYVNGDNEEKTVLCFSS